MGRPLGRPVTYGRQIRVRVTPADQKQVYREASLLGVNVTEVMRRALAHYFALPEAERKERAYESRS